MPVNTSDRDATGSLAGDVQLIGGISDQHAGLTPGAAQYLDALGAITETDTGVPIDRAVSATEIIVTKAP